MSAFPLTRRAALRSRHSGAFAGGRRSERAGAAQRPVPQHCGRRLAVAGLHGRSDGCLGAAGASRRAGPGLGRLHGAPGDRDGATLVARIDDLYLGPSSGGTGPWGAAQDTINGRSWSGARAAGSPPTRRFGRSLRTTRWPSTSLCASSPITGGLWLWRRRSRAGRRESSGSSSEASPSGPAPWKSRRQGPASAPGRGRMSISALTRRAAIGNLGAFGLLSVERGPDGAGRSRGPVPRDQG